MASPVTTVAEQRAKFLRLAALVIDGGALALKTQFDGVFPPHSLTQDLQTNKKILKNLGRGRVLKRAQLDLLLPAPPVNADSSTFDVCLFACLIQNLPAFGQQNSPVWGLKGLPPSIDKSLAADVQRLRFIRNQLCHATTASITDQEFKDKSQEVIEAIQRQGQRNPDVQVLLYDFQNKTIDPIMEKEYLEKLKEWERFDRQLQDALEELQEKVDALGGELAECKEDVAKSNDAMKYTSAKIEEKSGILEEHEAEIERINISVKENAKYLKENIENIDGITQENKDCIETLRLKVEDNTTTIGKNKTVIEQYGRDIQASNLETKRISEELDSMREAKGKGITSEYETLFANSKLFFQSREKNEFIKTRIYMKAEKQLQEKKIIILTGHPGEGKTCTAKELIMERFAADRCLNITHTTDWDHVNLVAKRPDVILIDDIFGVSVFDKSLFDYWRKKLADLLRAAKEYDISVILTSRHYILEESKIIVKTLPPFNQRGNIILLSSDKLTDDEKVNILESHLKAEERSINRDSVIHCISNHADFQKTLFGKHTFKFGFPQCADLYCRRDDLFNDHRETFFKNPNAFFKKCIEELYENEQSFLALILLWVKPEQELHRSETSAFFMSEEIKTISKELGFEMNGELVRSLEKSLDSHIGGLLHLSNETGLLTFSHHVIGDMIGLVTAQHKTQFVLQHGDDQFLFNFAATGEDDDEFKFQVPEYLYGILAQRFAQMMLNIDWSGFLECDASLEELKKGGKLASDVYPNYEINFSIVKQNIFDNETFAHKFVQLVLQRGELQEILECRVMSMSGFFMRYGIKLDKQKFLMLSYTVYCKRSVLANALISKGYLHSTTLSYDEIQTEYVMALLFAVHYQMRDTIELLLRSGTQVPEEAIYIAVHRTSIEILRLLLTSNDRTHVDGMEILNGNNALIVATKKGFSEAVKCLLDSGYDLSLRNKDRMSALDKAIVHKHENMCEILVNAGAPLEFQTSLFKRTPLHTAVDLGLVQTTKLLLQHHASVYTRDRKGFYPIHTAAYCGRCDIVQILLTHDPSQVSLKTKTYGFLSELKGVTALHVAVIKKNYDLVQLLLDANADTDVRDWHGQTPLFSAVTKEDLISIEMLKGVSEVDAVDKKGFTALHRAVHKENVEVVKALCSVANVNAIDKFGKTPLHVAVMRGKNDIFVELVKAGADWRMVTNRGDTVLHLAVRHKDKLYKTLISFQQSLQSLGGSATVEFDGFLRPFELIMSRINQIDPEFVQRHIRNKYNQYAEIIFNEDNEVVECFERV